MNKIKSTIPKRYFDLTMYTREGNDADRAVLSEMFTENVYRLEGHMLRDEAVVVDIGANIGAFTIQALKLAYDEGKTVTVYAVEPEEHNLELLRENLDANPRLFERGSEVIIIEAGISYFIGNAKITNDAGNSRITQDEGHQDIDVLTFGDLLERCEIDSIDFTKIDIEGSEVGLFLGASESELAKSHYYAVEWDESNGTGMFLESFKKFLSHFSFETWGIPNNGCNIYLENHHWEK